MLQHQLIAILHNRKYDGCIAFYSHIHNIHILSFVCVRFFCYKFSFSYFSVCSFRRKLCIKHKKAKTKQQQQQNESRRE